MRGRGIAPAVLAALLLTAAPAARAQEAVLSGIEALVAAGRYADARERLEAWWAGSGEGAPSPDRARALFLRARLTADPLEAQRDYLAIALGHPTSPPAAEALLYLGQGLLATGDVDRARTYLERLTTDYPASPHRATGLLWLARARTAAGRHAEACTAARETTTAAAGDPDLLALARAELAAACGAAAGAPATAATAAPSGRRAGTVAGGEPAAFGVQAGAFRDDGGARALAGRLRRAGLEPRIVVLPGSSLRRVRVGLFPEAAGADALARRLRTAGFAAFVVNDVARERPPG